MLIDSHAHIFTKEFHNNLEDILDNAASANVGKICMPNIDETTIDAMMAIYKRYPDRCFPMMGLHPTSVTEDYKRQLQIIKEELDSGEDFIAIGEMGIDLYWDKSLKTEQIEAFKIQVEWAVEKELPIVIHSRESMDLILDILEELNYSSLRGVFHCFTGNIRQAERVQALGFYIGIGGILTFKNSPLPEVIPSIELSRIILETDSPYLSPEPRRGRRNEPAHIKYIAEKLAVVTGRHMDEIAEITTSNVEKIYKWR